MAIRWMVPGGHEPAPASHHNSRAGDLMTGTAGSIVLYTCDGAFDSIKGEYTRRFVVKADPVDT